MDGARTECWAAVAVVLAMTAVSARAAEELLQKDMPDGSTIAVEVTVSRADSYVLRDYALRRLGRNSASSRVLWRKSLRGPAVLDSQPVGELFRLRPLDLAALDGDAGMLLAHHSNAVWLEQFPLDPGRTGDFPSIKLFDCSQALGIVPSSGRIQVEGEAVSVLVTTAIATQRWTVADGKAVLLGEEPVAPGTAPRPKGDGAGAAHEGRGSVQASETTLGLGAVVVKIVEGKAFFCWTSGDKGGGAALYRLELREGPPEPVRFHTFGPDERIEPGDVRWDMDHDTLFCLGEHPFPPLSPANPLCWVLRYPVKEMRPGPPGAPILPPPRREVDATGREVDVLDEHGFVPPDYGNVDILGLAGWHPGQEVPAFHCDIRVATSSSIRIYVASDARFRVWRYDGERCQAEGAYPLALVGPFRVASNGRTVIMQVSGTWVVLKDVREHATLAYKLRLLQSDQPPLVLDFSETGETCLVQTDRCLRIGEDDIDPIEFEKAPERVRMASQMIWRTLRESGPAAKRTGTTGEGAAEDAGRKRRDDADLERARELLAELLETRHAGGDIRAQVLDALRGGRDSRFSDDISALLLSRLDKLDGAEALIEAYTACGAYLERPSLEEGTRAALVDRAGLGRTAQELLGGDALLGVLARYMALAELQELADISEREGRADEVDRVRGFVRREAGRLLQDWPKLDLRAMVEEMAGAK